MIKPRNAIARIGVGLAIVAGLSMGVPAASFAQEEFDTSQVSSITQNADTGITVCTNNADKAFSFQCAGTSATGYRQKDDSSSLYLDIQGYTGNPLRLYTDGAYNTSGSGSIIVLRERIVRITRDSGKCITSSVRTGDLRRD